MPSLTRKLIKGRPCYYLRHCQRIDGKPRIVETVYLATRPGAIHNPAE